MRRLNQEISDKLRVLSQQKKERQSITNTLYSEKKEIEAKLARQEGILSSAQKELRQASLPSRGGSYSTHRIGGLVFPVAGPCGFSDSWGAPRVGHRHQGCDIMAREGTPVVACVSGSASSGSSGGGGLTIYLHGNDGNTYYYMHLSSIKATGSVSAGQVIGAVGHTGNASSSAPHLHFEIHPGGGGAVNPYPYLR